MADATREAVLAQIHAQKWDAERSMYGCGCHQRGERWWLCQYHDGYEDGYDDAADEVVRLREALTALTAAVEAYQAEWETPAPDLMERARCRDRLWLAAAAAAASDGEADK